MPTELPEDLQKIQDSRQGVYGDWDINMDATSRQMDGLLRNYVGICMKGKRLLPLPNWWCPLMMVTVKLNRIASGNYHKDNFDDLRVYLSFVERMQRQDEVLNREELPGEDTIQEGGQ